MARFILAIAALAGFALGCAPAAAQERLAQLSFGHIGEVAPGAYEAGDNLKFSLTVAGDDFLLRFDGNPEVFVLYNAHVSLGGRDLKYDSGEIALQVANWGGMTLYTDAQPNGLPAVRTGDALPPPWPSVSLTEMQNAASDEAEHLAYMRGLRLVFTADWAALNVSAPMRSLAFDTLENTVRGLDIFSISAFGRELLAKNVALVTIAVSDRPRLSLHAHTLTVTFNPGRGYEGRASSRAIARALGQLLPKK